MPGQTTARVTATDNRACIEFLTHKCTHTHREAVVYVKHQIEISTDTFQGYQVVSEHMRQKIDRMNGKYIYFVIVNF